MKERRKRMMKRLVFEELERRAMLNGTQIAMQATGLTNNSYEDFYKAQVGTEIGGAAGVGMLNEMQRISQSRVERVANVMNFNNPMIPTYPEATTGTGQMTITTGANTLGIGSFATPTAGPSRAGGTGNADLGSPTGPVQSQAADQAILELSLELPSLAAAKGAEEARQNDADDEKQERAEQAKAEAKEHRRELELVAAYRD